MARLKFEIHDKDTYESLDDGVRALYEPMAETDGKSWRLAVDGAVAKSRLDEMRSNNLDLSRQKDRLSQEISKLLPPEKVTELAEKLAQEKTRDLNDQLTRTLIDKHIGALAGTAGVRPEALDDVTRRAHDVFKVAGDGKLVPRSATGDDLNLDSLLKPDEWLTSLKTTHPHYWAPSSGGGAAGGGRDENGRFKSDKRVKYREDLTTPMMKSEFIKEHGLKAFEALKSKHQPNPYSTWQAKQPKQQS